MRLYKCLWLRGLGKDVLRWFVDTGCGGGKEDAPPDVVVVNGVRLGYFAVFCWYEMWGRLGGCASGCGCRIGS